MANYIEGITHVYLNPNTYTTTNITNIDLRNTPWINNSMRNSFSNCYNLVSVSNISNTTTDLTETFSGCSNLQYIGTLPDTCEENGMTNTFRNCRSMTYSPVLPRNCTALRGTLSHTYLGCSNLTAAPAIPNWVESMPGTFIECRSLSYVGTIPNSVTNMHTTFGFCTALTDAPEIPDSVTNMSYCFTSCENLVNVPHISNSVRSLDGTFSYCTSLKEIPILPDSIVSLSETFRSCKITDAVITSDYLTNVSQTFRNCKELTNAVISSANITNATNCFADTTIDKNVYIPFYNLYRSRENTATRLAFAAAGYDESGALNGVHLKTLSPVLSISTSTPNAMIQFEANGQYLTDSSIAVPCLTTVNWTVRAPAYVEKTGSQTILNEDMILDVQLEKIKYTLTVIPVPADATVTLDWGTVHIEGQGTQTITVDAESIVTVNVKKEGYSDHTQEILVTYDTTTTIELDLEPKILTINPDPEDAVVVLTAPGFIQEGNSIGVPAGASVAYKVYKEGFDVQKTGAVIVNEDMEIPVSIWSVLTYDDEKYNIETILATDGKEYTVLRELIGTAATAETVDLSEITIIPD